MARDPHEIVDFAPAWLNFNNSNKKKSEKPPSTVLQGSLPAPLKSQEPIFRSQGGSRLGGSPSRSGNLTRWSHQSPASRPGARHLSAEFSPEKNDSFPLSPNKDQKSSWSSRSGDFSSGYSKHDAGNHYDHMKNGHPLSRPSPVKDPLQLESEFPSLCDRDVADPTKGKQQKSCGSPSNVVNMWEKPLVLKSADAETNQNENAGTQAKTLLTSSIYKTLVPKPAPHKKQPYRRTMSVPLSMPSKPPNSNVELITSGSKREHSAIGRQIQPSAVKPNNENAIPQQSKPHPTVEKTNSVDIGFVSNYKKHRKGKSHFLKALRQSEDLNDGGFKFARGGASSPEQQDLDQSEFKEVEDCDITTESSTTNAATYDQDFLHNQNLHSTWENSLQLSSSLEAEHRLLREMGWNCSDEQAMEEEPPLTEDEINEFFSQNKTNGMLHAPSSGNREIAFRNAISEWKFSGIRKPSNNGSPSDEFNDESRHIKSNSFVLDDEDSSGSLTSDDEL